MSTPSCTLFAYMTETTYTQARANLKALLDEASDSREIVIIRRRDGNDVALIAADELRSLIETAPSLAPRGGRDVRKRSLSFAATSVSTSSVTGRKTRAAVFHDEFREDLRDWVRTDRRSEEHTS